MSRLAVPCSRKPLYRSIGAADGSAAIEDEHAKSVMAKLDFIQGVSKVREELEHAGFPNDNLSDDQVADLGRRIAESPIRHFAGNGN